MELIIFIDNTHEVNYVETNNDDSTITIVVDSKLKILNGLTLYQKSIYNYVKKKFNSNIIFIENDDEKNIKYKDDYSEGYYLLNNKYLIEKKINRNNWGSSDVDIIKLGYFKSLMEDNINGFTEEEKIKINEYNGIIKEYYNEIINNPIKSTFVSVVKKFLNLVEETKGKKFKCYISNKLFVVVINYFYTVDSGKFFETCISKLDEHSNDLRQEYREIYDPIILKKILLEKYNKKN